VALESFTCDIPAGIEWADEKLSAFGRWSDRRRGGRTCGSAEGDYRAPVRGDDDVRRAPLVEGLRPGEALLVSRCLSAVPDQQRVVLRVLYVPQRLPIVAQLRILRIPPKLCRVRHELGLRSFANLFRVAEAVR